MLKAILIAKTTPDWNTFLLTVKELFDQSVTEEIERKRLELNRMESYHSALNALCNPLDHIHYTFLITGWGDYFLSLIKHCNKIGFSLIESKYKNIYVSIATGSLLSWKQFIIECSDGNESSEIRILANQLQSILENEGLYRIFNDYTKIGKNDSTYLLEQK